MVELRQFNTSDIDFILNNWSTKDCMKGCCLPYNAKQLAIIINKWATKIYDGKYFEQFAILDAENIVGMISLYEVNSGDVSVGIIIDDKYYKKGYATQAVNFIKEIAKNHGYKKLVSTCRIDNYASIKLHEKCGFINKGKSINKKANLIYSWYYDLYLKHSHNKKCEIIKIPIDFC